jgi:hypothetical protein
MRPFVKKLEVIIPLCFLLAFSIGTFAQKNAISTPKLAQTEIDPVVNHPSSQISPNYHVLWAETTRKT